MSVEVNRDSGCWRFPRFPAASGWQRQLRASATANEPPGSSPRAASSGVAVTRPAGRGRIRCRGSGPRNRPR
jgi:hypothetical protein